MSKVFFSVDFTLPCLSTWLMISCCVQVYFCARSKLWWSTSTERRTISLGSLVGGSLAVSVSTASCSADCTGSTGAAASAGVGEAGCGVVDGCCATAGSARTKARTAASARANNGLWPAFVIPINKIHLFAHEVAEQFIFENLSVSSQM